jgi:filamentous hemagglutinin
LRLPGPKNPDYRIEGILFDCYAPRNAKPRNIAAVIEDKIGRGQANSFVINLKDSTVSIVDLQKQILDYPINGLNKLIIICSDDTIISFL